MTAHVITGSSHSRPDARLKSWVSALLLIATAVGLGFVATRIDATQVAALTDALRRMGAPRFAAYCAYSLGVYVLLGVAWLAMMPAQPLRAMWLLSWARLVREATSDLLPFSQLGGVVLAFRLLIRRGLRPSLVYASFTADLGVEMASQLVFTLAGLAMLGLLSSTHTDGPILLSSVGSMIVVLASSLVGLVVLQRALVTWTPKLATRFAGRIGAEAQGTMAQLRSIYSRPLRVAAGFAVNLTAWFASAAGAWLVLHWSGTEVSFATVIGIESLIFAIRAVAFIVPAGIGVQELAYVVLFPHFGLSIEAALMVALVKRGRDVAIGVPTIVLWQVGELRTLARLRMRLDDVLPAR